MSGGEWVEAVATRNGRRVPLCEAAIAVLEKVVVTRQGDFVFAGNKTGQPQSRGAMVALLKRMVCSDVTYTVFRRRFVAWARLCEAYPG